MFEDIDIDIGEIGYPGFDRQVGTRMPLLPVHKQKLNHAEHVEGKHYLLYLVRQLIDIAGDCSTHTQPQLWLHLCLSFNL